MAWTFALLCLAAAALVAGTVSALVALGLKFGDKHLKQRTPEARARILLVAALLPTLTTVAVMVTALAPWFGWIADHCHNVPDTHGHPLICCGHYGGVLPTLSIFVLAGGLGLRIFVATTNMGSLWLRSVRLSKTLIETAERRLDDGSFLLPMDVPQAFVLGLWRPKVFLTRGLLAQDEQQLAAVVAHETAHIHRADPLRRLVANLALAFHLPGVARMLQRALTRAHEMAADEHAAKTIGSRSQVAETLVRFARITVQPPAIAYAFADSEVEARVVALLGDRPRIDTPRLGNLIACAVAALLGLGLAADAVHHGIEILLGIIS